MTAAAPKRLLALSGGGVRGIVEIAYLEAIQDALSKATGVTPRLCDVFDLVGGTSTGALIATSIALGHPISRAREIYIKRASRFFGNKRWWAMGTIPMLDAAALQKEIRRDVGDNSLGSGALQTNLAIVTKRLDTGSPWILSNIPGSPYFDDPVDGSYVGNRHYRLCEILRAATAAPTLFSQQRIQIGPDQDGVFIDGGLSPFNDPSLALLQLARMKTFGLNWPTGADRMHIVSIGTGRFRNTIPSAVAMRIGPLRLAYQSLMGLMKDTEAQTLMMMEWMGTSPRPAMINSEIGMLENEFPGDAPLFSFLRLDLPLEHRELSDLGLDVTLREIKVMRRMDDPAAISLLYDLTRAYIELVFPHEEILAALRVTRQ